MTPTAKEFKDEIIKRLKEGKTSWGKNELILFVNEAYAAFLERFMK